MRVISSVENFRHAKSPSPLPSPGVPGEGEIPCRMRYVVLLICTLLLLKSSALAGPTTMPAKEYFHIYLLMGQSNMVGRGTDGMDAQQADPHILAFTPDGQWVVAKDPLHGQDGRIAPGVGPGMTFAQAMVKADPTITIGLVPCAVGGTGLKRWVKNADLYEKAITRAKLAAQVGTITGVLWHQGESDADKQGTADVYEKHLTEMFTNLREDLELPNLPIVVGQLGPFLKVEKHPYVETIRAALKRMPENLPHVGFADSDGLKDKGDSLHFTADSQREFGKRYATVMQSLMERTSK